MKVLPNIKSSILSVKTDAKRHAKNVAEKTRVKKASRKVIDAVAAGNADTAFELLNRDMSNHGRGRLMVRELCCGVERKRYGELNETVYHVKMECTKKEEENKK